jgi:predicted dehydrogenase
VENETLGKANSYQIAEGGEFEWPAASATFFQKAHSGGGVLLDLGAHTLDLVEHWFGEPTAITYEDDADGGLEATCCVEMCHVGGVTGQIRLSRDWRTSNRLFVEFERGWVSFSPGMPNRLEIGVAGCDFVGRIDLSEPSLSWGLPAAGRPALTYSQCFTAQLQQFVHAIQRGGPPLVTGVDGLSNLRLIERCYALKAAVKRQ